MFQIVGDPIFIDQNLELDEDNTGLYYTRDWVIANGSADIDLYAWTTNSATGFAGIAYSPGACSGKFRTSLTAGPRRGVVETAEVSNEDSKSKTHKHTQI